MVERSPNGFVSDEDKVIPSGEMVLILSMMFVTTTDCPTKFGCNSFAASVSIAGRTLEDTDDALPVGELIRSSASVQHHDVTD